MLEFFQKLDRRWIFLLMFLAIALPILFQTRFPEVPTDLARATFDAIEDLPEGSRVLLSFDFDPASEGELGPMATAFTYHCAAKKHKMYFMALWPVGPQLVKEAIAKVIKADFPWMQYGRDYMDLGFKSGQEGVIKVIITDFRELYTTDAYGTPFNEVPMCKEITSVQDMDLVINISAGYAGSKEWVQYAVVPYPDKVKLVAGVTGVQAPLLYPYVPDQLPGMLGAIKGAAEYEKLVSDRYGLADKPKYQEGIRRMGPQLVAHLLMILLILAGNAIYLFERRREAHR